MQARCCSGLSRVWSTSLAPQAGTGMFSLSFGCFPLHPALGDGGLLPTPTSTMR